jgi:hypothetical protein
MAIGDTATVTVTVKTGGAGSITDTATVSATTGDPDHSNDTQAQATTVVAQGVAPGPSQSHSQCTPTVPRSSISRNALDARVTTIRLVGRTLDFTCLGLKNGGGIKRVRLAIALHDGSNCRFLTSAGSLTSARSCSSRTYLTAKLGHLRNGKVPWTFRKRNLSLPAGRYDAIALGTDGQNRNESKLRTYNLKHFRIR